MIIIIILLYGCWNRMCILWCLNDAIVIDSVSGSGFRGLPGHPGPPGPQGPQGPQGPPGSYTGSISYSGNFPRDSIRAEVQEYLTSTLPRQMPSVLVVQRHRSDFTSVMFFRWQRSPHHHWTSRAKGSERRTRRTRLYPQQQLREWLTPQCSAQRRGRQQAGRDNGLLQRRPESYRLHQEWVRYVIEIFGVFLFLFVSFTLRDLTGIH